jgi:hypothetical protein
MTHRRMVKGELEIDAILETGQENFTLWLIVCIYLRIYKGVLLAKFGSTQGRQDTGEDSIREGKLL